MTADEGRRPDNGANDGLGGRAGAPRSIRDISEVQTRYILENFNDATVYPPRQGGEPNPPPVEFIYRRGHLLTSDQHLQSVLGILATVPGLSPGRGDEGGPAGDVSHPIPGLALIPLMFEGPDSPLEQAQVMFNALDAIEQRLGRGVAAPDHMMSVTMPPPPPATHCPATEPDPVAPGTAPLPGISRSRCDGHGTLVVVVDTGLVQDAPARHPWLNGVTGDPDLEVNEGVSIVRYGGHGTFIASIVRAMAPRAEVRVKRVFERGGAIYESDIVKALLAVLDWAPDVISLSAGTHTWLNGGLLSFQVFVNGPLRERKQTVLVAAAGNDGLDWKFSPAEMEQVIGVGALGPPGDARAWFSDYGDWVKVYAPGQDLVHAFASGTYTYQEQNPGTTAGFTGMASWSGTSFSTPVVSGLIAARMSGTGESAHEAAESLLRLARAQAVPGVGPVLHPGQACLCACEHPCRDRHRHGHCGCHSLAAEIQSTWQSLGDRITSSPLVQQLSTWARSQRTG
jgi:subtilisin family serine protease